jgi:hypothetical protein
MPFKNDEIFDGEQELRPIFKDGDTTYNPITGQGERIRGIDTRETGKVDIESGSYVSGEVGAQEQADLLQSITKENNLTERVQYEQSDATGTRTVIDWRNPETGQTLSGIALSSGASNLTNYSTDEQISQAIFGRLEKRKRELAGTPTELDTKVNNIRDLINSRERLVAKPLAINEAQLEANRNLNIFSPTQVQYRSSDRGLDNEANSYARSALTLAGTGLQEGMWGIWDLTADAFGAEDNAGQRNLNRIKLEASELPSMQGLNAFDEDGNWNLSGIKGYYDYIIGNSIISAPYMAISIASAMAAPATYGLSLGVPGLIYGGQTYSAQEEKNIPIALVSGAVQGALDLIGIKGGSKLATQLIGEGPNAKKAIKEIADSKFNGNVKEAEKFIASATTKELTRVSAFMKDQLADSFKAKYLASSVGKSVVKAAAAESITEALQEAVGYSAENWNRLGNLTEDDYNDLQNILLNSAVAGAFLGGTYGGVGQATQAVEIADYLHGRNKADLSKSSNDFKYQQDLINTKQSIDIESLIRESDNSNEQLANIISQGKKKDDRTKRQKLAQATGDLFRGSVFVGDFKFLSNKYGAKGVNTRKALALAGGNKIYFGDDLETHQQIVTANLSKFTGTDAQVLNLFPNERTLNDINEIMKDEKLNQALDDLTNIKDLSKKGSLKEVARERNISLPLKNPANQDSVLEYADSLDRADMLRAQYLGTPKEIGFSRKTKNLNRNKVKEDREGFTNLLINKLGFTALRANNVYRDIIELNEVQNVEDFGDSFLDLDYTAQEKLNIKNIMGKKEFEKYFESDIFANVQLNNTKTGSTAANKNYLGVNGSRPAYFIKRAVDNKELTPEEAAEIAEGYRSLLGRRAGTENRIENEYLLTAQNFMTTATTINSLTLAPVSGLLEVALSTKTLSTKDIFKTIVPFAQGAAIELYDTMNHAAAVASKGKIKRKDLTKLKKFKYSELKKKGQDLGYELQTQSASARLDAQGSAKQQQLLNSFFRYSQLNSVTNIARNLSIAASYDAIDNAFKDIESELNGTININSLEAREMITHLKGDIDSMLNIRSKMGPLTESDIKTYDTNMQRMQYNFVNDAVAHPTKTSRPNFYQNPKTALIFQFQGFIATFTSRILPQILKQPFNGTIINRVRGVRNIAFLLSMGFLVLHLKSLIKYGEIPDWLEDEEKFQLAVGASGLLGSAQRVVDIANPVYDNRSDNFFDSVIDFAVGDVPALGYTAKLGNVGYQTLFGETTGDATKAAIKAAPGLGPFTELANQAKISVNDIFGE